MNTENSDSFYRASPPPEWRHLRLEIYTLLKAWEGGSLHMYKGQTPRRKCEQSGCILLQSTIIKAGHLPCFMKTYSFQQA